MFSITYMKKFKPKRKVLNDILDCSIKKYMYQEIENRQQFCHSYDRENKITHAPLGYLQVHSYLQSPS